MLTTHCSHHYSRYAVSLMGTKAGTKAGQAELKAARKAGAAEVDGSGPGLEPNGRTRQ